MIDIEFYMKAFDLKYRLMNGERMPREVLQQSV